MILSYKEILQMRHNVVMLLYVVSFSAMHVDADNARFRIFVADSSTGTPIAGVVVRGTFTDKYARWENTREYHDYDVVSGRDGMCDFKGRTNCGCAGFRIGLSTGKPWVDVPFVGQYYHTPWMNIPFVKRGVMPFAWWQPDNIVVTVRLQRVEHPVALFVKQFNGGGSDSVGSDLFAKGDGHLQLDMVRGEWLPPIGNGEYADVVFTRLPHEDLGMGTNFNGLTAASYRDSMEVKFMGDGNGLAEVPCSDVAGLMIRTAPQDGYRQNYLCWKGRMKDLKHASHFDKRRNFAFRIRTQRDGNGKITSAYYGKIYGDINFKKLYGVDVEAVAAPSFLYYLNPTPLDRNLEWDMKNNLCPNPGKIGQFQP